MARISVVVPIHNVERFLDECLRSIAGQSFGELDVIMVDDGSTDSSAAIAARFAAQDRRFRLVQQENAGLSAARNRGVADATGEFLAFADSDDVLPRDAYRVLLESLDATGSDFASGGVRRIEHGRIEPAPYSTETFARTRLRTHVSEFKPLLADRTAWNTLWRRTFWDQQGLRFPDGAWHEDIPVKLRAHVRATSVDVLSTPVYHWRLRDGDQTSITQRRLEQKSLDDRLDAVEYVYRLLVDEGPEGCAESYRARLLRDDLRLHLNVLHHADDAYRATFMERVSRLLEGTTDEHYEGMPANERLEWDLVRSRRTAELVGLLRAERRSLSPRTRQMLRRIPRPIRRVVPRSMVSRIVRSVSR